MNIVKTYNTRGRKRKLADSEAEQNKAEQTISNVSGKGSKQDHKAKVKPVEIEPEQVELSNTDNVKADIVNTEKNGAKHTMSDVNKKVGKQDHQADVKPVEIELEQVEISNTDTESVGAESVNTEKSGGKQAMLDGNADDINNDDQADIKQDTEANPVQDDINNDDQADIKQDTEARPVLRKPFISEIVETGTLNTKSYRVYLRDRHGYPLSLWHDIPFKPEGEEGTNVYNMVIEVPRYTNARLELSHTLHMNPIVHARNEDGSLSYCHNIFPFKGYPFNYGYFPQTYTDPNPRNDSNPASGDGDLLDAIEISSRTRKTGEVVMVKVLGAFAFIVDGKLDWKVVCVDVNDPLTQKINEIHQLEVAMPGFARAMQEFFALYNVPRGENLTPAAFRGMYKKLDIVNQILSISHTLWKKLIADKLPGVPANTMTQTRHPDGFNRAYREVWDGILESDLKHTTEPAPVPEYVNSYYYVMRYARRRANPLRLTSFNPDPAVP